MYVIESKYLGSNHQLHALARIVSKNGDYYCLKSQTRSRSKFLLPLYLMIAAIKRHLKPGSWLARTLTQASLQNADFTLCDNDILICKTPPFELPALILAAGTDAKIYYLGTPKRVNRNLFHCIISTPSTPARAPDILLHTLPTSFTYNTFLEHRRPATNSTWALLIGGNARGFTYSEKDWKDLTLTLAKFSATAGVRWLCSTSPRTPPKGENILKAFALQHPELFEAIHFWSNAETRPSVLELLTRCEGVVVTEDSASMISEAVNTRLPTICLRPFAHQYNSLTTTLATQLESLGALARLELNEQTDFPLLEWRNSTFRPLTHCWSDTVEAYIEKNYHSK